jgi:hypothetical protein
MPSALGTTGSVSAGYESPSYRTYNIKVARYCKRDLWVLSEELLNDYSTVHMRIF